MGDGVLVEFTSAVNAVKCAVQLQKSMDTANQDLSEEHRIILRIGINLGDVIVEGADLYGDGINIASRLQALAEPGTICVSSKVYEEVNRKLAVGFEDLGECELKNLAKPLRVYCIASDVLRATETAVNLTLADKPSIAVLPFENLSGDPAQQYFSDGVTEDIITELSRFHSLYVIARNSSFQFRGKAVDVKRVGRDLGARYIVEGSVRRIDNQVRVTVQLIDAKTSNHVWAERYDRELNDIFVVQDEITQMIAATAAGRVENAGAKMARRKSTGDLAAYDCVLHARGIRRTAYLDTSLFMQAALSSARELLGRAIQIDPDYARAYAELAWTHIDEWFNLGKDEDLEMGFGYAQSAARLDPEDSTCQRVLGMAHLFLRRYQEAGDQIERALSINPNDIWAVGNKAFFLTLTGRPLDAKLLVEKAMRLDRYQPAELRRETLGYSLYNLGQYEEALAEFRGIDPKPIRFRAFLAACYAQLDRMDEARTEKDIFLGTLVPASASPVSAKRLEGGVTVDRESRLRALQKYIGTYKQQSDRDGWLNAMRKAGIPV
jgi:TolB-like protein/tetratricopeptide (TPR) repeat protein